MAEFDKDVYSFVELGDNVDITTAWDSMKKGNVFSDEVSVGYYKLKHHTSHRDLTKNFQNWFSLFQDVALLRFMIIY